MLTVTLNYLHLNTYISTPCPLSSQKWFRSIAQPNMWSVMTVMEENILVAHRRFKGCRQPLKVFVYALITHVYIHTSMVTTC